MNPTEKKSYLLYGFAIADIHSIVKLLENLPGTKFALHESFYIGGIYYRSGNPGQEEFVLQNNLDSIENEFAEPEFQKYSTILYIGPTNRPDEIIDWFETNINTKATLLRHRKI